MQYKRWYNNRTLLGNSMFCAFNISIRRQDYALTIFIREAFYA